MILPRETLMHAFSYCDARVLAKASQVCRTWRNVIYSDFFWKHVFWKMLHSEKPCTSFPAKKLSLSDGNGNIVRFGREHFLYAKNVLKIGEEESIAGSKIILFGPQDTDKENREQTEEPLDASEDEVEELEEVIDRNREIEIGFVPIPNINLCSDGTRIFAYSKKEIHQGVMKNGKICFNRLYQTKGEIEQLHLAGSTLAWNEMIKNSHLFLVGDLSTEEFNLQNLEGKVYDMSQSENGKVYLSTYLQDLKASIIGCIQNGQFDLVWGAQNQRTKIRCLSENQLFYFSPQDCGIIDLVSKEMTLISSNLLAHTLVGAEPIGQGRYILITANNEKNVYMMHLVENSRLLFSRKIPDTLQNCSIKLWMEAGKVAVVAENKRFLIDFLKRI